MAKVIDADVQAVSRVRAIPNFRFVVIALMFVGATILWADRLNISMAAPAIVKEYGWSPTVLGGVFSAFTFGYLIAQIPGGRLGDAMPRRLLGITGILWSLFTAITPFGRTPALMVAIRSLLGFFEGPFLVTLVGMIARWVPRTERGIVNGIVTSPANWAPVIFLPFAAFLVHNYGWPSTFYVFALLGLVWVGVWFALVRDLPEDHPAVGRAELERILDGRGIGAKNLPMGPVLRTPAAWATIVGWIGVPYSNYMMLSWLPTLFATRFHIPLMRAGALSALPFLCSIFGQLIGGIALDRLTVAGMRRESVYRLLIGISMFGTAISFYLATVHFEIVWVTTFISIGMGLMGMMSPQVYTLAMDISPPRSSSLAGIMNFAGIAGAVVSPFLTGWIVETSHQWAPAFYVAAGVLVVACTASLILLRGPLAVPDVSPN